MSESPTSSHGCPGPTGPAGSGARSGADVEETMRTMGIRSGAPPLVAPPAVARPARGSPLRLGTWILHMAVPILSLWLLVANPSLDLAWNHHMAHFGLVLAAAAVAVTLGAVMGHAARARRDARLFLVSLVFLTSAGFLGAHALATPGVLLDYANTGFIAATPAGLLLGGAVALASSAEFGPACSAWVLRHQRTIAAVPWALLAGWVAISLAGLPPLDRPPTAIAASGITGIAAAVGTLLYTVAALRYLRLYRRRPSVVLLSVLTAFVLLAEALVAIAFATRWHLSWWEWHLLMTLAYAFIGYSAYVQFRREGSARGLFDAIATEQVVADLRRDYSAALEAMVDVLHRREQGEQAPLGAASGRLAERFDLTESQVAVLERAAHALGAEREQVRKLGGLVAVGREASVIQDEDELLRRALRRAGEAFRHDELRLGLVRDGRLAFDDAASTALAERALATLAPVEAEATLALPLIVKGRPAGVLQAGRRVGRFSEADTALLHSLASQLSIALENARLYHQLDGLFRSYMSPAVATALVADPDQAGLGGTITEVSVLMADLRGFTPFSESTTPDRVVDMLNTYYGAVVPVLLDEGGTIVQFVGDAVMAIFNAPVRQPDHALRAARAGLRLHRAVAAAAAGHEDWPRFRVGINTGPALVGNIGAAQMRNFTAIGDTTNLAARLEALAEPGSVVLGPLTRAQIGSRARVTDGGAVQVKGKRDPVPVCVLHEVAEVIDVR